MVAAVFSSFSALLASAIFEAELPSNGEGKSCFAGIGFSAVGRCLNPATAGLVASSVGTAFSGKVCGFEAGTLGLLATSVGFLISIFSVEVPVFCSARRFANASGTGLADLSVGLIDPESKQTRVRFAVKENYSDRWMPLGQIVVQ